MPKKKETLTQELTIIDKPSQAIALYKITPEEIAERLKKYDSLKVIKGDSKSYKEVRGVLTALVHTRAEVEKRRLKLGGEYRGLVEKSISNINKAAGMLANPMAPYEERFRSELKTEDARLDAIKAEKIRIEEERKENIKAEIHKIQEMAMPTVLGTMALENLRELSNSLEDFGIDVGKYMEFTKEAEETLEDSYNAVQDAITARIKLDEEAAERKAEAEHLEKIRKKQEADQAKIDAANKKLKDDKAKLEADKQAEDQRKEKEAFKKAATEKAEKDAKDKLEQIERDKTAKATAQAAEKAQQEALAPDKDKLIKFADNLLAIRYPPMESAKTIKLMVEINGKVNELAADIKKKAQEL